MAIALSQIITRKMRFAPMVAGCLVLAAATVGAAPVWGQDPVALTDRLERLENTLKVLQGNIYRGKEPPTEALTPLNNPDPPSVPLERLHVRVSEFEEALQKLTGEIEEIGFAVRQMATRLDRLVADMDFRLRSVEQASTTHGAAQTQPNIAPAATAAGGGTTDTPQFPSVRVIGQVDQQQPQQIQAARPNSTGQQVATVPMRQPVAPAPQATAGGGTTETQQFPSVRIIGQVDQRQLQQIQAAHPNATGQQVATVPMRQPAAPASQTTAGDGVRETPQPPSVPAIDQFVEQQLQQMRTGGPGLTENQVTVMTPQVPIAPTPQIAPAPEPVQQQGLLVPPQAPTPQMTTLPAATPEAEYEFAYDLLLQRDYPRAEAVLADFVVRHPNHPLAGNAQYWLGETFYVRQNYMAAARTFATGWEDYPESTKAPHMLLKLGMSLNALKRTDDACITFTKLIDEHPQATASVRRAERERGQLSCP